MEKFVRAGVILQERQLAASAAARLCDQVDGPTAVGYGGARGGGKSHWLLAQMVFSRQADGTTIAQQYLREGIKLRPANMDRVNGWAEILQRLGDGSAKILPSLFIHQRCGRLVETLPAMQHDPHRPEDVLKVDCDEDGVGGDDAADCLRYLVATKARTVTQRKLRGV
jgi:hypothetical protein